MASLSFETPARWQPAIALRKTFRDPYRLRRRSEVAIRRSFDRAVDLAHRRAAAPGADDP